MSRAAIIIRGNQDRHDVAALARQVPVGCVVSFKHSSRSLPQNAKLWAMLTDIARQVNWYGQKLTAEDWKDIFTATLRKTRVVPGLDGASFVPLGMRTSKLTKQEFGDLLEIMHAFAAEQGVTFRDDEPAAPQA